MNAPATPPVPISLMTAQEKALNAKLLAANEKIGVLTQQLAAAENELVAICNEQLALYHRFHKPGRKRTDTRFCPKCQHRHLSKAHGHTCPHCPCKRKPGADE